MEIKTRIKIKKTIAAILIILTLAISPYASDIIEIINYTSQRRQCEMIYKHLDNTVSSIYGLEATRYALGVEHNNKTVRNNNIFYVKGLEFTEYMLKMDTGNVVLGRFFKKYVRKTIKKPYCVVWIKNNSDKKYYIDGTMIFKDEDDNLIKVKNFTVGHGEYKTYTSLNPYAEGNEVFFIPPKGEKYIQKINNDVVISTNKEDFAI